MGRSPLYSRSLSLEAYLSADDRSQVRHEFVDGQLFAMSGGTRSHSRITLNVATRLFGVLNNGPCRVHVADMRLRLDRVVYYPDVMVACSAPPVDLRCEVSPSLLVEVLSPSTEATDRREKLMAYRAIPSLDTYLIIAQDERRVDRHWRDSTGVWQCEVLVGEGFIELPTAGIALTLDEVFKGVEMPTAEQRLRLREEEPAYW